jgi:predicted dehydrogenase
MDPDAVRRLFTGQLDQAEYVSTETKTYDSVWGAQHAEVLRNFAAAVRGEEELLAPGSEGIHGVRLANAIHLSSWLGQEVSITDFDEDRYLAELNTRIAAEGKFPTRA